MFSIHYVTNGFEATYEFPDKTTGMSWNTSVLTIKHMISDVKDKIPTERAGTVEEYREWIDSVHSFINDWGKEKVPKDIRISLNEVEEGCGLPITTWP